jgi:hypothetical protein
MHFLQVYDNEVWTGNINFCSDYFIMLHYKLNDSLCGNNAFKNVEMLKYLGMDSNKSKLHFQKN